MTAFFLFIYAVILLLGGVGGYFQKIEGASIIIGAIAGVAMMICSLYVLKGQIKWAVISLIFVIAITSYFIYSFYKTLLFYPHGIMSAFSLLMLIFLIGSFLKENKKDS